MTVQATKLFGIKKSGESFRIAFVGDSKSKGYQLRTAQYKLQIALKKKDRTDFINALLPIASAASMTMPKFLTEHHDNDADYKACAYAFLMGLSAADSIKEEQKMENTIYVNKHNQGQSEIWNDESEFRNYFLPYTNDNGEFLNESTETWELIETINRDSNLYEIVEENE